MNLLTQDLQTLSVTRDRRFGVQTLEFRPLSHRNSDHYGSLAVQCAATSFAGRSKSMLRHATVPETGPSSLRSSRQSFLLFVSTVASERAEAQMPARTLVSKSRKRRGFGLRS